MDALHIACAIQGQCSHFITTDKVILKKSKDIEEVKITDPIFFIKEIIDD